MPRKHSLIIAAVLFGIVLVGAYYASAASVSKVYQVYMVLEEQTTPEGTKYFEIENYNNANVVKQIPTAWAIQEFIRAGSNVFVSLPLGSLKPEGWSLDETADWISQNAKGFVAFDLAMMDSYAAAALTIQGTAYTYAQAVDAINTFKWRTIGTGEFAGEYVWATGKKSDYLADSNRTKIIIRMPETVPSGTAPGQ